MTDAKKELDDRFESNMVVALAALERRGKATCARLALDLRWSYVETYITLELLADRGAVVDEPLADDEVNPSESNDEGQPDLFAFRSLKQADA